MSLFNSSLRGELHKINESVAAISHFNYGPHTHMYTAAWFFISSWPYRGGEGL